MDSKQEKTTKPQMILPKKINEIEFTDWTRMKKLKFID